MNPRDGTCYPDPDLGHTEKPRPRFDPISCFWGRLLGRSWVKTMVFGLLTPFGSGCPRFQAKRSHGDPDRVILDVFDPPTGSFWMSSIKFWAFGSTSVALQGHFWGEIDIPFWKGVFFDGIDVFGSSFGSSAVPAFLAGALFFLKIDTPFLQQGLPRPDESCWKV